MLRTSSKVSFGDAARRARVLLPDDRVAVLVWVGKVAPRARVVVLDGKRSVHERHPTTDLRLLDFVGDERDGRGALTHCGPCGAMSGDHLPECPRAGRPTMKAGF